MRKQIKFKLFIAIQFVVLSLIGSALTAFAAGALSIAVSSGTVKAGDTVTVTLYAEGEGGEEISADMSITYDAAKLEYVSSTASNATGGGGTVKVSGSDIDIKFKAIGQGDAYVKAENSSLTAAGTHIMVSGTAAGTASSNTDTANAAKSGDNSLSSLKISQGTLSPAFRGSVTEYTAEVGSDVNEITVTPIPANSKATVESVTGNTNLKEGTNVITVVVKAENGTSASYKITVTKGGTSTASGNNENAGGSDAPSDANEPSGSEEASSQLPQSSGQDTVVIDGENYTITSEFSDAEIPEGFSKANYSYKGNTYQGIGFNSGYMGMYYLVNDAGEGKFFIYDKNRDRFYPYVRLNNGDHYIMLITVPNGVIPPDGYEETTIDIGETRNIPAYHYAGGENDEIVRIETEDGEMISGGASYFYIFYGMDAAGNTCWYQYDAWQGTYQRLNEEAVSTDSVPEDYETLAKSYKELDERQKATRIKDRRIIAILIFLSVAFFIIIINLLLKVRELKSDEDEYEYEETPIAKRERPKKERPQKERPKKVRTKEQTRSVLEEAEDADFYDDDDDGVIDEFEEDPVVLGRKPKKKEKPKKQPRVTAAVIEDDDDDIEFLDL